MMLQTHGLGTTEVEKICQGTGEAGMNIIMTQ